MAERTGIAWTDHTFNPWWGCTRVSPGCENCYAETWDRRFDGGHWGVNAPRRFFGDKHWNEPLKWNREAEKGALRHRVFIASMADVFEDRRDLDEQRERVWRLCEETPWLDKQLLTKRPQNILRMVPPHWLKAWPAHVWIGTTVEDQKRANERISHLALVPAAVRFLSVEPQLEALDLTPVLEHIDWVIVGGESGSDARNFRLRWARSIVEQCKAAGVAVFVKQLGAHPWECDDPTAPERIAAFHRLPLVHPKGENINEWPADLRIREFPRAA